MSMSNRRRFIQQIVSVSVVAGIAGCTGDNGTDSSNSGPPEPETGWQEYLPHCSSGDFTFRVRGVNEDTVSIENMGVESLKLSSVSVVYGDGNSEPDVREDGRTIYTDIALQGGESQSFSFDGVYGKEIVRIGVSTDALEGRDYSEDEPCWGQP